VVLGQDGYGCLNDGADGGSGGSCQVTTWMSHHIHDGKGGAHDYNQCRGSQYLAVICSLKRMAKFFYALIEGESILIAANFVCS